MKKQLPLCARDGAWASLCACMRQSECNTCARKRILRSFHARAHFITRRMTDCVHTDISLSCVACASPSLLLNFHVGCERSEAQVFVSVLTSSRVAWKAGCLLRCFRMCLYYYCCGLVMEKQWTRVTSSIKHTYFSQFYLIFIFLREDKDNFHVHKKKRRCVSPPQALLSQTASNPSN